MRCRLSAVWGCALLLASDVRAEMAFPFELREGFMWVKVCAPQSPEPLNFLFDTGAEVSTLNLQTAKRLKLNGGRPVKVTGVGGKAAGYWPQQLEATVAGVKLPTQFLVTDLCALQASCQCPVDGLLGADFFRDRIVQIDFRVKNIRLLATAPDGAKEEQIPIRFRRSIMQVPLSVDGNEPQWIRLDTGCASALEWVSATPARVAGRTKISIGLSSVQIPTSRTTVRFRNRQFHNVQTGIHGKPLFPSEGGLLGLGLLARFEQITIDARSGRLILSDRVQ